MRKDWTKRDWLNLFILDIILFIVIGIPIMVFVVPFIGAENFIIIAVVYCITLILYNERKYIRDFYNRNKNDE